MYTFPVCFGHPVYTELQYIQPANQIGTGSIPEINFILILWNLDSFFMYDLLVLKHVKLRLGQ